LLYDFREDRSKLNEKSQVLQKNSHKVQELILSMKISKISREYFWLKTMNLRNYTKKITKKNRKTKIPILILGF
jgi:hypothetical protein